MRSSIVVAIFGFLVPTLASNLTIGQIDGIKSGQIDPSVFDSNFVHFECGNDKSHVPRDLLESHRQLSKRRSFGGSMVNRASRLAKLGARAFNPTVIPVYFHFVTKSTNQDAIPVGMWQKQLGVLNRNYGPGGFVFRLAGTTRTVNDDWAVSADPAPMQKALRKGGYSTLNIYFVTDLANNVLGQCSMPTSTPPNIDPAKFATDGCLINAGTMPDGNIYGYNMGYTAVHEVGHWMGLLHTFEGYRCDGDGDHVDDTPAQSKSTSGCPTSKDSCPNSPGMDAVHNFMDYSTDACYRGFTPGQILRMKDLWSMYRQGK